MASFFEGDAWLADVFELQPTPEMRYPEATG